MRFSVFVLLSIFSISSKAQPYFELLNLNFAHQPTSSLYKGGSDAAISNQWYLANLNLPLKINHKNILILTLGWEQRNYKTEYKIEKFGFSSPEQSGFIPDKKVVYETFYLPLCFQHLFTDTNKSISGAIIYRYNKLHRLKTGTSNDMLGGALIYSRKMSDKFTWKAGAYYNREFFGNYFMPLIGCEWNIHSKLNLWGLIPRNMVLDYAISKVIHAGFNYKGLTESYRNNNGTGYFSFTEGQLKLFCDIYLGKGPWVISMEAGQTAAREYEFYSGIDQEKINQLHPEESSILKACISYRVITNKNFRTPRGPEN